MGSSVQCDRCGQPNGPDQRFCGGCGAPLGHRCPSCGGENAEGFRFCGHCGASLEAAAPAPAPETREERRWVTVVFADLSGFTRLSEHTDPEDVRTLVDGCVARMADIVASHGGWFDKVMGDGVLAVFGADVAHGDDAERAVRAALALRRCAIENRDEFGGLEVSIGVNTGEVMFAAVGPTERREQTVIGDAVNTAARLQAAAQPGTILVGEETWRSTRALVRYEQVEPVRAKGKQEPVRAWAAVDADPLDADRPLSAVPLVGRNHELAGLTGTWSRTVAERRPQLVTVFGPAGIGKTKLAQELSTVVQRSGGRVFRGRSLPYGESTGYGAFAQAIKQTAGVVYNSASEDANDALRRRVRQLLPAAEADEVTSNLATLAGLATASGADKQSLFFSARRFVEELAREAPTLLVFEDIHWADPTLLELIESLASRCRDAPVLILTLARPELLDAAPRWGGGVPVYAALTMEPLPERHAQRLAALHLGLEADSATAARLAAIAEGNPLFIEELSSSVAERATDIDDRLPTNVRGIIAARLDALPSQERSVLLDAAVIGKVFWRGALAGLGHAHLDAALDALDRRDLIRREPDSQLEGDQEFTFRHILIREVAYATVPRAARRQRHAATARFIEAATGARSVEWASALAHHWREAAESGRAVDYLISAAQRAGGAWAAEEATQLYTEAIQLLPEAESARRRDLRLARGMLLVQSAFYAESVEDLDAVLPELERSQRADALLARGNAAVWLMDGHLARRCGEEALALARDWNDELVGPALSLIANAGAIDGRLQAALDLQRQSLASWKPGRRTRQLADHLAMMALTSYWVGDNLDAVTLARQSYEMAVENQSVTALLQGGSHLAMALAGNGQHDEAIELFEKVIAQGRELEAKPRLTSRTMNMMASALREVGEEDDARSLNEEGLECARQADFTAAATQAQIDLLFGDLRGGEVGAAEQRWRSLRETVESLTGWHQWLGLGRLAQARAELTLVTGDAAAAADQARESVTQAVAVGRRKYEALGLATLGSALSSLGHHEDALAEVARAREVSAVLGHPPTTWRVGAAAAAALAAAGQHDEAHRVAEEVRQDIRSFPLSPLRRERFLDSRLVRGTLALLPSP